MGFVNLLVNSFVFELVELLLWLNLNMWLIFMISDFFFFKFLVCGVFIDFVIIIIVFFWKFVLALKWPNLFYVSKKTVSMIATVNNLHGFSFYGFYIQNDWIVWLIAVRGIVRKICVAARWLIAREFALRTHLGNVRRGGKEWNGNCFMFTSAGKVSLLISNWILNFCV